MPALDTKYVPSDHEDRITARWLTARAFHADPERVRNGERPAYCILLPPPNVTARLHLGHAFSDTMQDILVRAHRMMGYETLWMPGTDHAGIATQTVVDKRLKAAGEKSLVEYKREEADSGTGREAFVQKVQDWKDDYEHQITEQLKAFGCSLDWDRQRFTMDEICARAVREAFFQFFKDGLIYRGKRLVNWDPVTQTALADDEVEMEDVESFFWYLDYPVVDDTGSETGERVTVATTRPETYFGDTAVAVNPKDPERARFIGMRVRVPFVGRLISVIGDDYVVMPDPDSSDSKAKYASGFLKVTPAHDPNDYEIGQRHDLEQINVMAPDASISDKHGWEDVGDATWALGKSREDARALVEQKFEEAGLLSAKKAYAHAVGHSYRSHVPVEPYLSDQWYCRVSDDRLVGSAQRALSSEQRSTESYPSKNETGDGELSFSPARYAKTYESWHDGLRDWCISRQLWWGHRIPVWSKQIDIEKGYPPTADIVGYAGLDHLIEGGGYAHGSLRVNTLDGTEVDAKELLRTDRENGRSFLVHVCYDGTHPIDENRLEEHGFAQDPDVLDTWFSSALWPLSTMGWPHADLPSVHRMQIDAGDASSIRAVWVKRVGTWKDFIGEANEESGELIDRLLHLRDNATTADGGRPLSYQLFRSADLERDGKGAEALSDPKDIQEATDLVCAVGIKERAPVESTKYGALHVESLLLKHGFQDTQGLMDAFNPTSVLCTGRDIITLWVSRMVMFNRYFKDGDLPYRDVYINPIVQDGHGQRMSKSLGNGVDPLDIVHSHGADALRLVLCQIATNTQDVRMPVDTVCPHTGEVFEPETTTTSNGSVVAAPIQSSPSDPSKKMVTAYGVASGLASPSDDTPLARNTSSRFDVGRNICTKLWNAARFAMMILEEAENSSEEKVDAGALSLVDRWMLGRLQQAVAGIDEAVKTYQFSKYAELVYDLLWRDFCDWYLEAIKPTVRESPAQQAVLRTALDVILRVLHPITPFVTEVLYERLRELPKTGRIVGVELSNSDLLCVAGWPRVDASLHDADSATAWAMTQALVETLRQFRAAQNVPNRQKLTLHAQQSVVELVEACGPVVPALAGLERVTTDSAEGASVEVLHEGEALRLSGMDEGIDPDKLRAQLADRKKKLAGEIGGLKGRLNNPGYVQKAPAHLVDETKAQLVSKEAELADIDTRLQELA